MESESILKLASQANLTGKFLSLALTCALVSALTDLATWAWPWYQTLMPSRLVWTLTLLLTNVCMVLLLNTGLMVVYRAKIPFIEEKKVLKKSWPWEEDYPAWRQQLRRTVLALCVNWGCLFLVTLADLNIGGMPWDFSDDYPTVTKTMTQLVFFVLVEDLLFYAGHRALHSPRFYWIHKQHHQYNNTVGIAAEYCHPLQFIFTNMVPFGFGPKLLGGRVHGITYVIWSILKLIQTTEAHCGYDFGFGVLRFFPCTGSSDFHNFHHSYNVGNFGVLTLWDRVFGTDIDYLRQRNKLQ